MPEPLNKEKIREMLLHVTPDSITEQQRNHILEQYKLYVEMTDRISDRRQQANTYFLTINTVLVTLAAGFIEFAKLTGAESWWLLGVAAAGWTLCYTWYRLIESYKQMNSGRFKVIHELERCLPASVYDAEWEALGRGKDPSLYTPFTETEMKVPVIFGLLYGLVAVFILWNLLGPGTLR